MKKWLLDVTAFDDEHSDKDIGEELQAISDMDSESFESYCNCSFIVNEKDLPDSSNKFTLFHDGNGKGIIIKNKAYYYIERHYKPFAYTVDNLIVALQSLQCRGYGDKEVTIKNHLNDNELYIDGLSIIDNEVKLICE